jgi:hypothetical protein
MRHAFIAALAAIILGSPAAMATAEPPFKLEQRQGGFEVRQYEPMIVAEVIVEGRRGEGRWIVRFVMPQGSTMANLPVPNDPDVRLIEQPGARFAVVRFTGLNTEAALTDRTAELNGFMAQAGLKAKAAPVYAFYDPPWTPPFMRRNEVMIAIE